MSSYLNIYVRPIADSFDSEETKKEKEATKCLMIASYPRSSDLYKLFTENINISAVHSGHTELTKENIALLFEDVNKAIKSIDTRISVMRTLNRLSSEQIDDLLDTMKYLEELKTLKEDVEFLNTLKSNCDWCSVKVYYNIG